MTDKHPYNILIVEDNDICFLYASIAFEDQNLNITRAISGYQAIEMITKGNKNFDLILMDIKLPGIDGFETTKEIRKLSPQIPVIAQTAQFVADDTEKFEHYGFNAVLLKPFLHNDLLNHVYSCLN